MINSRKKGFTLVELVIVIAVIAILAAVLIPTFSSLVKKANMSSDQQAVRQMNMVLAGNDFKTINDAVDALDEAGYNALDTLTPVSTGYSFWWVEKYNSIVLLNEKEEVVFASNNDAKENFTAEKQAGKAYNLKRGLDKIDVTEEDDVREALEKGQSVTLKENMELGSKKILVLAGEDVVIDLGGKEVTIGMRDSSGHNYAIDNHGTITITNGTINSRGLQNWGTLILGEDVELNSIDSDGGAAIWNYAGGEVVIKGGTYKATAGDKATDSAGIIKEPGVINNSGKITIDGGTFEALNTGCYAINNYGEMIINGGTFTGWRGVVSCTSGSVVINGGTFKQAGTGTGGYTLYQYGSGIITLNGGTFEGASFSSGTINDNRQK